jgi:hypothetical protein
LCQDCWCWTIVSRARCHSGVRGWSMSRVCNWKRVSRRRGSWKQYFRRTYENGQSWEVVGGSFFVEDWSCHCDNACFSYSLIRSFDFKSGRSVYSLGCGVARRDLLFVLCKKGTTEFWKIASYIDRFSVHLLLSECGYPESLCISWIFGEYNGLANPKDGQGNQGLGASHLQW